MNINQTTIEIDKRIFGNFNPEDLQNKRDLLGFYKKSANTYVLSTRLISENPNFNSNILDLASILNNSIYDPDSLVSLTPNNTYMVTRYLNCVYKVISKHNAKVEKAFENPFLYAFRCIPIIGRIVQLFYYTIQEPSQFLDNFKNRQKEKLDLYFLGSSSIVSLRANKEEIDRAFRLASQETAPLHGNGFAEVIWSDLRKAIAKSFEKALENKDPALAKARKIIVDQQQPLDFVDGEAYESVAQKVSKLIQDLHLSDEIARIATEGQIELRVQAIARVKYLEANWVQTHLDTIYARAEQIKERPSINQLLGVNETLAMVNRFLEFYRALTLLNQLGNSTRDKLERSFNHYIQPLFDNMIADAVSVQYAKTPKEVKEQLEKFFKQLEAYKLYRTPFPENQVKKEEIARKEESLLMIRDRTLCRLVPVYAEARSILKMSNPSDSFLIEQSSSANFSENWYEEKLRYFEFEMSRISAEDFSKETYEIILKAKQHLQTEYAKCKKANMEKVIREQSQTKGFFASVGTMLMGKDAGKEQPTKMYKESLLKLLGASDKEDFADAYAKKLRSLEKLPDHEALKSIIQTSFKGYNRAMQIQPFVTKVASGLWSTSIKIEDINPKNKPLEAMREETLVLTRLIEEEIVIQMQNGYHGLVSNLQKAKEQIENLVADAISQQYPAYKRFVEYQKKYANKNGFPLSMNGVDANTLYKEEIDAIEKEIKPETPSFISAAAVQAMLNITYAYKEWEADRILAAAANYKSEWGSLSEGDKQKRNLAIYGLKANATLKDVKIRERVLFSLLHEDKNLDLPPKLKVKVIEASKILGAIH